MEILLLAFVVLFCFVLPTCFALWARRSMNSSKQVKPVSVPSHTVACSGIPETKINRFADNGEKEKDYRGRDGSREFEVIPLYIRFKPVVAEIEYDTGEDG